MKIQDANIQLIIGLGNPGGKYAETYHNVGHLCIDFLKKNLPPTTKTMIKSDSFMNTSGAFVKKKMDELDLSPEQVLIIHDDSDIQIGEYKLSFDRGSAGHNGIKSVIEKMGTKKFWRARIGVRPNGVEAKAETFVLQKISPAHRDDIHEIFWKINEALKNEE